jgi:hypothetical protein
MKRQINRMGYRAAFAALAMALSACASAPVIPAATPPSAPSAPTATTGYMSEKVSANRYRVFYRGGAAPANFRSEAMKTAAQVTLDNGKEWFEIVGSTKASLEIVMGKGETLAGGATQYDARDVLKGAVRTS